MRNVKQPVLLREARAASALSYGLLLGLIAVATISAIGTVGTEASSLLLRVDDSLSAQAGGIALQGQSVDPAKEVVAVEIEFTGPGRPAGTRVEVYEWQLFIDGVRTSGADWVTTSNKADAANLARCWDTSWGPSVTCLNVTLPVTVMFTGAKASAVNSIAFSMWQGKHPSGLRVDRVMADGSRQQVVNQPNVLWSNPRGGAYDDIFSFSIN